VWWWIMMRSSIQSPKVSGSKSDLAVHFNLQSDHPL
jgi:hypothetical protein